MDNLLETLKISETIQEDNEKPFDLLPKEIIVSIFDKISDAKSLCNCYLVSKLFSSLVLQTKIVSLQISSSVLDTGFMPDSSTLETPPLPDISSFGPSHSSMINFLTKFSHIVSVTIYLTFSKENQNSLDDLHVVKWSFDKHGLIFVSAKLFDGIHYSTITFKNDENILQPFHKLSYIRYILHMIWVLIRERFPNLKEMLVLDNMKEGRIYLGEEDIIELRDATENDSDECVENVWQAPLLRLPSTGRVMTEITVNIFTDIGLDDFLKIRKNDFDVEFYELATIMVKKNVSLQI